MGKVTKNRECGNKERLTKAEAKARAAWWRKVRFARMHSYRCTRCDSYHVGHWRAPGRRKVRR